MATAAEDPEEKTYKPSIGSASYTEKKPAHETPLFEFAEEAIAIQREILATLKRIEAATNLISPARQSDRPIVMKPSKPEEWPEISV